MHSVPRVATPRFLKRSLGGNTKTVMCANAGPAEYNYDETVSTLRCAGALSSQEAAGMIKTVLSLELELFVCTGHDLVVFFIGRLGLDRRTGGWLSCLLDLLLILHSRRPSPLPAAVAGLKPNYEVATNVEAVLATTTFRRLPFLVSCLLISSCIGQVR